MTAFQDRIAALRPEVAAQKARRRASRGRRTKKKLRPGEYDKTARVTPTEADLERLYFSEELSYEGIAERLGCSRSYVMKLMRKHGIKARPLSVAIQKAVEHGRPPGVRPKGTPQERLARRRAKAVEAQRRYRKNNPEKSRARWRVSKAIRRGTMIRLDYCQRCKKECKPEAHHEDYSKALEVEWLCRRCHREEHSVDSSD